MNLVSNTNAWRKDIQPGHIFLWTAPWAPVVLYSRVLAPPHEGLLRTQTFGGPLSPQGATVYVPERTAVMLLSLEQLALASRLGWPQDEEGLTEIFGVPAN